MDGLHDRIWKGHVIPQMLVRDFDRNDARPALFHFEGQKSACRPDFQHAFSGKDEVPEIFVDAIAQIAQTTGHAMPRKVHNVVEIAVVKPRNSDGLGKDRAGTHGIL